jgi:hypothetical protein
MPVNAPAGLKINSLVERAMISEVKISKWSARKHDKFVSKEVAQAHGLADETMGAYRKQLIGKKALEELNKIASEAREVHYELTLPWDDNGKRILVNIHFTKYCEKMREFKARWDIGTRQFMAAYQSYKDRAMSDLGTMYREEDYPPVGEMQDKFGFEVNIEAMPSAADYRVHGIIDGEVQRIKEEIEKRQEQYIKDAMKEPYRRLQDVLMKMSERLKSYTGTREGCFHDSLVSNVVDLVDIIPGLNLTEDQNLEDVRKQVQKDLINYSAKELREDEKARETVAASADDILKAIEDYI